MNGSYKPGTLLSNASWTPPAYSGLVTQITGYKLVNSFNDLKNVSSDLAGNYALGRDIDASGSYVPIGSNATPFMGQFDGQGRTINSVSLQALVKEDPAYLGLFGTLGERAVVHDLNVNGNMQIAGFPRDIAVPGTYPAIGDEGILAADNYGTILRVSTSGGVSDRGYSFIYGGGLVGVNHGLIERSSSSASIGSSAMVGGLVGENDGVIDQSYASGDVAGRTWASHYDGYSEASPGGLVGINTGNITKSYATGAVTNGCFPSDCGAGGLVALNTGTISQSFTNGAITLSDPGTHEEGRVGAVAETNDGTIANDVYWNKNTTGLTNGVGTGTPLPASNGLTTAQMSNPASFSGWNFSSTGVWALPAGYTHPILRWQIEPPTSN